MQLLDQRRQQGLGSPQGNRIVQEGASRRCGAASLAALSGALFLGGCGFGGGTPVACTAESAQAPVVSIIKEQLEKAVASAVKRDDGSKAVGLSKIRAAISQLVISIRDIRTSKEDPNSTKRFCTGTLSIGFPADALSDADRARSATGMKTVSDLADDADVERHADHFTSPVDFNVQPTDDGSKIFAETESGSAMVGFAAQVIAAGLLNAGIQDARNQQQAAIDQQTAAQTAAIGEQRAANLAAARTDNQLALQTITASWRALDADTRARLLPVQRAWIRKKDADCAVEAASASIDPTEREVARLGCDTKAEQSRVEWLAPYRDAGAASAGFSGADTAPTPSASPPSY